MIPAMSCRAVAALLVAIGLAGPALAEPLAVEAVMSPKEQMRLDF